MRIISIGIDTDSEAFVSDPRKAFLKVIGEILLFMRVHEVCEKGFYNLGRRFYDSKNKECARLRIGNSGQEWNLLTEKGLRNENC